jgi:hypothetical protein
LTWLIPLVEGENELAFVPPLAIGRTPVTPGRGLDCNTLAAVVDAKLTSIDGDVVKPVPPFEIGSVPVILVEERLCV